METCTTIQTQRTCLESEHTSEKLTATLTSRKRRRGSAATTAAAIPTTETTKTKWQKLSTTKTPFQCSEQRADQQCGRVGGAPTREAPIVWLDSEIRESYSRLQRAPLLRALDAQPTTRTTSSVCSILPQAPPSWQPALWTEADLLSTVTEEENPRLMTCTYSTLTCTNLVQRGSSQRLCETHRKQAWRERRRLGRDPFVKKSTADEVLQCKRVLAHVAAAHHTAGSKEWLLEQRILLHPRTCAIETCAQPTKARHLCRRHRLLGLKK